jgi:hypothetical protein
LCLLGTGYFTAIGDFINSTSVQDNLYSIWTPWLPAFAAASGVTLDQITFTQASHKAEILNNEKLLSFANVRTDIKRRALEGIPAKRAFSQTLE